MGRTTSDGGMTALAGMTARRGASVAQGVLPVWPAGGDDIAAHVSRLIGWPVFFATAWALGTLLIG